MIKLLLFTTFLNTSTIEALPAKPVKIEARKRGKHQRGRKRRGLR
tara:strand:+ start:271 stop:405 length:135 start_codon:yes stop_codon:yes gene_type:complete